MQTELKLELLSRTRIHAGVSFLSIKGIDKRYAAAFNKMTVGFECEIADVDAENHEGDSDDLERLRQTFENQFSFTEQNFLNSRPQGTAQAFIDHYEVDPLYGFVEGPEVLKDFQDLLSHIDRIGYNVVLDPRITGERWLPPANFAGDYLNEHIRHQFTEDRAAKIDDERVKRCVTDIQMELNAFFEKYSVSASNDAYTLDNLVSNAAFIISYYRGFENYRTMDESKKRLYVWRIGSKIASIKNNLTQIINKLKSVEDNGFDWDILVFDENKGIAEINLQRVNGLASPLIKYDRDLFMDDYQEAFQEASDADWQEYQQDSNGSGSSGSNEHINQRAVENIHDLVVQNVDSQAELSTGYHSSYNKGHRTVVEPDSSIEPHGAEVVSKVFTGPGPAFSWLESVFTMIEDNEPALETNDSTGLHVNLGTFKPITDAYTGRETDCIDVVKLAVLSGDRYLLDQFNRIGNTYAVTLGPTVEKLFNDGMQVRDYQGRFTALVRELNGRMSEHQDKYRSINITHLYSKGYLEFRIAGGEHYHRDFDKVKRAVYRYMQLCAIACDPQAYQREYLKAIYAIIHPESKEDLFYNLKNMQQTTPIKNAKDAFEYLRLTNQIYHLNLESTLSQLKDSMHDPMAFNVGMMHAYAATVLNAIHIKKSKTLNYKLLYALRLVMIQAAHNEGHDKSFLIEFYNKYIVHANTKSIFYTVPLYARAIRFIYTGRGITALQQIESYKMTDTDNKLALLASTHITGATLTFYKNRSTPQVTKKGERAVPKKGYGPVVKRRKATRKEEEQLKKGKWLRVRHDGKGPNDRGAKRSTYRPHQGAKQKVRAGVEEGTYTLSVNDGESNLLKLLTALKRLGDVGSSREILIKEGGEDGQDLKFYWDGDGADKIGSIDTGGGEPITAKDLSVEQVIAALEQMPVTAIPHPNLNKSGKPETDNWTHKLTLLMREKNCYGTFENFLQNLKASCDVGTLTTVAILGSGNLTKFQIGGQSSSQIEKNGIDTIISIDKEINPDADVYTPEEQGATVDKEQELKDSNTYDSDFRGPEGTRTKDKNKPNNNDKDGDYK